MTWDQIAVFAALIALLPAAIMILVGTPRDIVEWGYVLTGYGCYFVIREAA